MRRFNPKSMCGNKPYDITHRVSNNVSHGVSNVDPNRISNGLTDFIPDAGTLHRCA